MKKLVIHLGPGKCGSSSIQSFFKKHKRPCEQKTKFIEVNATDIDKLNCFEADQSFDSNFIRKITKDSRFCDTLILSHEYFFQNNNAIEKICGHFKSKTDKIIIVGYSRRQSDFLVSAYSQWFFRSKERISEVKEILINNNLTPDYFTGLEQYLIAAIYSDFHSARQFSNRIIFNWLEGYSAIQEKCMLANIRCDTLPKRDASKNLIEDFCDKAELTLKPAIRKESAVIENQSFDEKLVEAINIATSLGIEVTTPHIDNEFLISISKNMTANKNTSSIVPNLKSYIDFQYLSDNIKFCQKFNIDPSYFKVKKSESKESIIQLINSEFNKRKSNKNLHQEYKNLVAQMAKACLNTTKKLME